MIVFWFFELSNVIIKEYKFQDKNLSDQGSDQVGILSTNYVNIFMPFMGMQ